MLVSLGLCVVTSPLFVEYGPTMTRMLPLLLLLPSSVTAYSVGGGGQQATDTGAQQLAASPLRRQLLHRIEQLEVGLFLLNEAVSKLEVRHGLLVLSHQLLELWVFRLLTCWLWDVVLDIFNFVGF